jgi:quinol monooxygenase YgiN/ketosteroid isomerase-like protein
MNQQPTMSATEPITVVVRAVARPGAEQRAIDEMRTLIAAIQRNPDCSEFSFHRGRDEPSHFLMYETWRDVEALQRHMTLEYFREYEEIVDEIWAEREWELFTRLSRFATQEQSAAARPHEVLQRFYAAEEAYLEDGDFGPVAEVLAPDVVMHQAESLPYGGVWRGHDGFRRWMEAFAAQWESLAVTEPRFLSSGDVVLVLSRVIATGRATGTRVTWPLAQVITVRDGRIAEIRPFYWDTVAVARALTPPSASGPETPSLRHVPAGGELQEA